MGDAGDAMARLFCAPLKVVQFILLLSLFCKKNAQAWRYRPKCWLYGNAAELSCGSQLSSVIITRSQPTKRSAITVVNNNIKAIAFLRLTRDLLAVNILILWWYCSKPRTRCCLSWKGFESLPLERSSPNRQQTWGDKSSADKTKQQRRKTRYSDINWDVLFSESAWLVLFYSRIPNVS